MKSLTGTSGIRSRGSVGQFGVAIRAPDGRRLAVNAKRGRRAEPAGGFGVMRGGPAPAWAGEDRVDYLGVAALRAGPQRHGHGDDPADDQPSSEHVYDDH